LTNIFSLRKILINSRLELIFTRCNSDNNSLIVKTEGTAKTGSVTIDKVSWNVSHVSVDDSERLKIMNILEKEKSLFIPFRLFETFDYPELGNSKNVVWTLKTASKLEKPRYVIIALH